MPLGGFSKIHEPDAVFPTYPIVPFTPTPLNPYRPVNLWLLPERLQERGEP